MIQEPTATARREPATGIALREFVLPLLLVGLLVLVLALAPLLIGSGA
jgi:hypothetical protein